MINISKNYYTISDRNNNYLNTTSANSPALTNTSPSNGNTMWSFFSINIGNSAETTVSTVINGSIYYLSLNGSASITTNSSSTIYYYYSNNRYNYLRYTSGSGWSQTSYYLRYNDGWTIRTSRNNNDRLTLTNVNFSAATVSITPEYYVTEEDSGVFSSNILYSAGTVTKVVSTSGSLNTTLNNGTFTPIGTFSAGNILSSLTAGTVNIVVTFDETNALNNVTFTLMNNSAIFVLNNGLVTENIVTIESKKIFTKAITTERAGYDTYFPLATEEGSFNVAEVNTGYIMGGSYASYQQASGDTRIGWYNITGSNTGLSTSLGSGSFSETNLTILTQNYKTNNALVKINDGKGNHTRSITGVSSSMTLEDLDYVMYAKAKENFIEVFNAEGYDKTKVYGLHFMDAAISTSHLVTAKKAVFNGDTYYDYQMPEDCIDFMLASKGYINFFAGSYYVPNSTQKNNSFFSLNEIVRYKKSDSEVDNGTKKVNEIKEIKKIRTIWGNPNANDGIYYYTYGTDANKPSAISSDSNYIKMFDTDWIERPSTWVDYALYYYEIPVNAGEYALGSVTKQGSESARYGAYLCYLDIGASDANHKSTLGSIDFVFDNNSDKVITVTTNDPSSLINSYKPSFIVIYTDNVAAYNNGTNSQNINDFLVKIRRTAEVESSILVGTSYYEFTASGGGNGGSVAYIKISKEWANGDNLDPDPSG